MKTIIEQIKDELDTLKGYIEFDNRQVAYHENELKEARAILRGMKDSDDLEAFKARKNVKQAADDLRSWKNRLSEHRESLYKSLTALGSIAAIAQNLGNIDPSKPEMSC